MKIMSFNTVSHIYDKTRGPPEHVKKQLFGILANELSDYKTILDAGVGTGRFAKPLQNSGFEVVGIDIAKKMIGRAAEKYVNNLLLSDACFLPFLDTSFDATICIHLLHLISEWEVALQEICRVTRNVMVSILYTGRSPIDEAYSHMIKQYGYGSRRLGKGEWDLRNTVTPSHSVFVASYEANADKRLEHLAQRAYSRQWSVPEDINKKVVDELKSRFAGKVFSQGLRLLIWNIADLKAYCNKS